jgi:hypothetical protein
VCVGNLFGRKLKLDVAVSVKTVIKKKQVLVIMVIKRAC